MLRNVTPTVSIASLCPLILLMSILYLGCYAALFQVIDGFSELMRDVFGPDQGVGVRSAVGMVRSDFPPRPVLVDVMLGTGQGTPARAAYHTKANVVRLLSIPCITSPVVFNCVCLRYFLSTVCVLLSTDTYNPYIVSCSSHRSISHSGFSFTSSFAQQSSLPFNIPVEVEATFRLAEGSSGASGVCFCLYPACLGLHLSIPACCVRFFHTLAFLSPLAIFLFLPLLSFFIFLYRSLFLYL